jgi:hypothetical protein
MQPEFIDRQYTPHGVRLQQASTGAGSANATRRF